MHPVSAPLPARGPREHPPSHHHCVGSPLTRKVTNVRQKEAFQSDYTRLLFAKSQ